MLHLDRFWTSILGCWLVGYPIAAFMFISDSALHWSERHPLIAMFAATCWLGPLVAVFMIDRRSQSQTYRPSKKAG